MTSHTLFDSFLIPEQEPTSAYTPENCIALWAAATQYSVICEVYEKNSSLFGFRFQAWVAWRDAGNNVRSHDWYAIEPEGLLTDNVNEAIECATNYANSKGVLLSAKWLANPSFKRDA